MPCGSGGYGSIDPSFARRVELLLVHRELQERIGLAPSLEVFLEEHRATTAHRRQEVPYRVTLERLCRGTAGS